MWSKNFSETVSRFRRQSAVVTVLIETIALILLSYTVAYDDDFDCDDGGDVDDDDDDAVQLSQYPVYSLLSYAN
jgi:hypothetical protein